MDLVRNRYNPEYFYNKAVALLDTVSKEEAIAWYNHDCTQSLRNSLEGDLARDVIAWFDGAFAEGNEEAIARGRVKAVNELLEHIEDIKQLSVEEQQDARN